MLTLWTWHWGIIRVVGNNSFSQGSCLQASKNSDTPTMCMQRSKQKALNVYHIANLLAKKRDTNSTNKNQTYQQKNPWTTSSPSFHVSLMANFPEFPKVPEWLSKAWERLSRIFPQLWKTTAGPPLKSKIPSEVKQSGPNRRWIKAYLEGSSQDGRIRGLYPWWNYKSPFRIVLWDPFHYGLFMADKSYKRGLTTTAY